MICESCTKNFEDKFGSGRFCSRACSNTFSSKFKREDTNRKISNSLKGKSSPRKSTKVNTCIDCKNTFIGYVRENRKPRCQSCLNPVRSTRKNIDTIELYQLSGRTISKIISRSGIACSICGWKECIGDIHHIIHKKDGGLDSPDNLIYVCPNHHRLIHKTKNYTIEFLKSKSLEKTFPEWRDFYKGSIKDE